jgi:manganese-transporting P-type ATPase
MDQVSVLQRIMIILVGQMKLRSPDESRIIDITTESSINSLEEICSRFDLCITGKALDVIEHLPMYQDYLLCHIWVYARVSPGQKETILRLFKKKGYTTLMCGDGTNDVGALKHADVGVALLNGTQEDLERTAHIMRERRLLELRKKQQEMYKAWGIKPPNDHSMNVVNGKHMDNLMSSMEGLDEAPTLKFGDASVAASFTSKLGSISSSKLGRS